MGWAIGQATYYSGTSNFGFYNNYIGSNIMTFTANSNFIGIGTTTPTFPLHVYTTVSATITGQYGYLNSNSNPTGTGSNTSNIPVGIYANGRVVASEIDALSDYRLKTNIQDINL